MTLGGIRINTKYNDRSMIIYFFAQTAFYLECPNGLYGDNCNNICSCRSDSECDFITGNCSCEPGYTGSTCHEPCQSGYYGNSCSEECQCNTNGTEECDHINGTCYCFDMWSGDLCEKPPCEY